MIPLPTSRLITYLGVLMMGIGSVACTPWYKNLVNEQGNVNGAVNTNITNPVISDPIDTSDWLTYTNEEYGFSFRYSAEFTLEESGPSGAYFRSSAGQLHNIKLFIQDYDDAPDKKGDAYALLYTKAELISLKNNIAKESDIVVNGLPVNYFYYYDVPGGVFLRGADFFVKNDYTRISMVIETDSIVYPNRPFDAEVREWSKDVVDQLSRGHFLSAEDQKYIGLFDQMISTLREI